MENLLLAVTGMSPQVITETLYALHKNGQPWPNRICLITTDKGMQKALHTLVEQGNLDTLCDELNRPRFALSALEIRVVPDSEGLRMNDARSAADHEALADFITNSVRQLTADKNLSIHASIAGGRKTMTFYLGYAMSLFGRHHDRLSHVLVNEPFENRSDFFFPTNKSKILLKREGDECVIDAKDAVVTLADIPFVRQRNHLPRLIMDDLGESLSYRHLMNLINLGDIPNQIILRVIVNEKRIHILDSRSQATSTMLVCADIEFPNFMLFAFYLMLLEATLEKDDSYSRPSNFSEADLLGRMLLRKVCELLGVEVGGILDSKGLATHLLTNDQYLSFLDSKIIPSKMLEAYTLPEKGLDKQTFSNYCNRINALFMRSLPVNLVKYVVPSPGHSFTDMKNSTSRKPVKGAGYLVPLPDPEHQIQIVY
ncbi:TIGR02584 family CRISPR-associated protein [Nitrincola tibetensis]|uniref:TIGR02584 family CRISPR-associated protein n=1 Tax=Nitrincola tibetensis TaxID=2219697 RepID=A0A364NKM3_9GAMM|nr:CRISPR-associated ring nuclease Csm6 [Nitrincola tibetensis]RAU17622.1 TIGR02584 family CRISPR-associated protein [Nitrincola tibetensis]